MAHFHPSTIIANARRLGIDAFHGAAALDLVTPIEGRTWTPICCDCLEHVAPTLEDHFIYRIAMETWQNAGGCARCAYAGCDTLVASLPVEVAA